MTIAETGMSAAMARAGMNTAEVLLRASAHAALEKCHGNVERATTVLKKVITDDDLLFREIVRAYLVELRDAGHHRLDDQISHAGVPQPSDSTNRGGVAHTPADTLKGLGPARREPSSSQRSIARAVARTSARTVLDICKTADGRAWGDVGAHELDGMDRDGRLARVVKQKLGALSNSQRFASLRELMTPDAFEACRVKARAEGDLDV